MILETVYKTKPNEWNGWIMWACGGALPNILLNLNFDNGNGKRQMNFTMLDLCAQGTGFGWYIECIKSCANQFVLVLVRGNWSGVLSQSLSHQLKWCGCVCVCLSVLSNQCVYMSSAFGAMFEKHCNSLSLLPVLHYYIPVIFMFKNKEILGNCHLSTVIVS